MNVGGLGQSITEWRELVNFINCGGNALPLRKMANCYDAKVACQKFSEKDGGDGEEAGDRQRNAGILIMR